MDQTRPPPLHIRDKRDSGGGFGRFVAFEDAIFSIRMINVCKVFALSCNPRAVFFILVLIRLSSWYSLLNAFIIFVLLLFEELVFELLFILFVIIVLPFRFDIKTKR